MAEFRFTVERTTRALITEDFVIEAESYDEAVQLIRDNDYEMRDLEYTYPDRVRSENYNQYIDEEFPEEHIINEDGEEI